MNAHVGCKLRARCAALLFLALTGLSGATAQLGVRVLHLGPYGVLGEVVEKKFGLDLWYMDPFEENVRLRAGFGYHRMTPRMDPFPTPGYGYEDGQWTVYPGTLTYTRFHILDVAAGIDHALFRSLDDRLTSYAGWGCVGGWMLQEYESRIPGVSDGSNSVSVGFVGLQARLGADMAIGDRVGVFLEATCNFALALGAPNITYAKHGIGLHYAF